ncbi:MAG: hypothetical protein QOE58_2301 [Actinomycetota bacterium]|jgi:hypothetical protein|nr:hypothetical protein [Actinomycetota bacterium]
MSVGWLDLTNLDPETADAAEVLRRYKLEHRSLYES